MSNSTLSIPMTHRAFKLCLKSLSPLVSLIRNVSGWLYQTCTRIQHTMDWRFMPHPEWYDHRYDLTFFEKDRKPHFFERGVYIQEVINNGDNVLDLCCGDGSVTRMFISPQASKVIGIDFDKNAIRTANSRAQNISNILFKTTDIRHMKFPSNHFDVISWDAAIEHFTPEEINSIMENIREILKKDGMLAGSTIKAEAGHQHHHDHEFEFSSLNETEAFLKKYFANVYVWERPHPDRTSFYFRCSNVERDLRERKFNR